MEKAAVESQAKALKADDKTIVLAHRYAPVSGSQAATSPVWSRMQSSAAFRGKARLGVPGWILRPPTGLEPAVFCELFGRGLRVVVVPGEDGRPLDLQRAALSGLDGRAAGT
jgi:hypothetical protein